MSRENYPGEFYEGHREAARRSAEAIVPVVLDVVRARSVVDVGCALGTWLSVFREHGVTTTLGIDGDWIPRESLEIPPGDFMVRNLALPLRLSRTFDLVVSLEVAEHLPPESAETFVESLTLLGPVVLFSAAIPLQGGTHHSNEQWPMYWVAKFEERGYLAVDLIRPKVWNDGSVAPWYAQNALLFVKKDAVQSYPALRDHWNGGSHAILPLVHPLQYMSVADPWSLTPGRLVKSLSKTLSVLLRKTILRGKREP